MLYRDYLKSKYQNTAVKLANAEGVPCVLEYSKGKNIRNYEIYGNSVQDGTPSPESPVEIQSVGDLTTKNLLPYPYIYTTKTINGVTFTDNGDGSITIDGTATANAVFYLVGKQDNYTLDKCGLKIGDSYTISKTLISGDSIANVYFTANYYNTSDTMKQGALATSTNTSTSTIQSDFKVWGIYLLVAKDKTVNNTTIKPQLEKGSSATEYEPYHKYDIPITVKGKNLFNKEDSRCSEIKAEPPTVIDINTYGVPVLLTEKVVSLFKPNTTYTISCDIECVDVPSDDYTFYNGILGFLIQSKVSGYSSINMLVTHQLVKGEIYHLSKTFTVPSNFSEGTYIMYVYRNSYKNSDGKIITASAIYRNIQIEEASSATAYEPYKGSETMHIYLDEPLRKVGDYADYIDFKNQKVVRKVKEKQLVGAERWGRYPSFRGFYSGISDMLSQNSGYGFCSHYPRTTKPENMGVRFGADNTVAYFTQLYTDENPLTTDEWKAKLAEWNASGNPLKVTYILAESTEENISLPALKTFKGTSVMSVDTAVFPSNIKAKYIRT